MEEKIWNWDVDFTIQHENGTCREKGAVVQASTLPEALAKAEEQITADYYPGILRHKIWSVAIITETDAPEEVF